MNQIAYLKTNGLLFTFIIRNCCGALFMKAYTHLGLLNLFIHFIFYYTWNNVLFLNLTNEHRFYGMQNFLYSLCSQITSWLV